MSANSKKSWRWTSTPLSADSGEISVMACVESLLAISISLGIAWYYQTITHIAVSACLAPFLLLRTRRTVTYGVFLYHRIDAKILKGYEYKDRIFPSHGLLLFFGTFVVRFLSLASVLLHNPLSCIRAIPFNWTRVVFCLDTCHPPESVPGMERLQEKTELTEVIGSTFWESLQVAIDVGKMEGYGINNKILKLFYQTISIIEEIIPVLIYFLPAIIYRWSLKSTALIWSPLLWIISSAQIRGPLRRYLDDIRQAAIYNVMRAYSLVVIILFIAKMAILVGPQTVALNSDFRPLLEPFVEPARLPGWQIASALSAILAWLLYIIADHHFRVLKRQDTHRSHEAGIKRQLGILNVTRTCLALYTIACTLYIAWQISADIQLPYIEFILFPWSD